MKKIIFLFAILSMLMFLERDYSNAKTLNTLPGGQIVYTSSEISDLSTLKVSGVNLSTYNYVKVYQYALVNSNTLFVLGLTKSGINELSSISLNDRKHTTVAKYSLDFSQSVPKPKFTVFIMQRDKTLSPYVMFEYPKGKMRNIEIFHANTKNRFYLLKQETIPLESKIFLSDANENGYTDILIWKKLHQTKALKENKIDDLSNGGMSVMFFNSSEMIFSKLILLRAVKMPSSEL